MYGSVVPAGLAQSVNVCGPHRLRGPSELLSEFQQRGGRTVQPCGPPVAPDTIRNFMIDLCPEVVPVRVHSIVTLVRPRHSHCEHFPLPSGKRRRTVHDMGVEGHRSGKYLGIRAHDPHDVPDLAGPSESRSILVEESSLRVVRGDSLDVGHGFTISVACGAPSGHRSRPRSCWGFCGGGARPAPR